jgi:SAM-dependent methyltransferase
VVSGGKFDTHLSLSAKRFAGLLRNSGVRQTIAAGVSVVEDRYLRSFDRIFNVQTNGVIELATTSVDPEKLADANVYAPVNAWGLRKLLRKLQLPKSDRFADLGCGLGRPVILAADYGFSKVTGVDFAPELCTKARDNVARSRLTAAQKETIEIIQADVINYLDQADDDVFFMFRPFSLNLFRSVVSKLADYAEQRSRWITVIYSERINLPESFNYVLADSPRYRCLLRFRSLGQTFEVHQCGPSKGIQSL